jgi:hypothetical protein
LRSKLLFNPELSWKHLVGILWNRVFLLICWNYWLGDFLRLCNRVLNRTLSNVQVIWMSSSIFIYYLSTKEIWLVMRLFFIFTYLSSRKITDATSWHWRTSFVNCVKSYLIGFWIFFIVCNHPLQALFELALKLLVCYGWQTLRLNYWRFHW